MDSVDLPLVWKRNAPQGESYTLLQDDGVTPFDLTGYTFAMQVRQYPGAPDPPLIALGMAAEGSPGFYLDNASAGQFTLTPPDDEALEALSTAPDSLAGKVRLAFDILLVAPDGEPEPFAYGKLTLYTGVTVL